MKATASIEHQVSERERGGRGTATVERLTQAGEGGYEVDPTGRQRIVAAPLDRLWKVGHITQREFDAGDKYRGLHHVADLDPAAPSVDWGRVGGSFGPRPPSMFTAQHIASAREQVRSIDKAIPDRSVVSVLLYLGLIKERALHEIGASIFGADNERDARNLGRAGFRTALASLADIMRA
ncbi:MAG: hypothetical protein Q8R92_06315 [Deltaproteobacteria bacterium]|nr:hypothetical protein [Deltaproteobacteria bacterium]